jgi:microcystin-dependent protein
VTGVETVTLTQAQIGAHRSRPTSWSTAGTTTVYLTSGFNTLYGQAPACPQNSGTTARAEHQGAGGDQPHTNMQPSVGVIVLVKT